MALAIQHKRSQTTGDAPSASDLAQGEIALNLADLRLFTKDHGTVGGISVTGFKMNFKKADGTLTTYNIFQQMMLFSLFQGHFVSKSIFNAHNHTISREVTFDNDVSLPANPNGTTITTGVPN